MPKGRKKKQELQILKIPANIMEDTFAFSSDFMYQYVHDVKFNDWSIVQKKLFAMVLDKIDWTGKNSNVIQLTNEEVAKELGWNYADENARNIGLEIRDNFTYMALHSGISLQDPNTRKWVSGNIISHAYGDPLYSNIVMNPVFMPHFESLYEYSGKSGRFFYTMLKPDIVKCDSNAGHNLFLWLRSKHAKIGIGTYSYTFSTKELKDVFGLPIDAYMRDIDMATGQYKDFNRSMFERAVLNKAIDSVNKSEQVQILKQKNERYYTKVKQGNRVVGYTLKWRVLDNDSIAQKRKKTIESNPNLLKKEPVDTVGKLIEVEDDYSDLFE